MCRMIPLEHLSQHPFAIRGYQFLAITFESQLYHAQRDAALILVALL